MRPQDLSSRYQPDLDQELRVVVGDASLPLYQMMRYHLGWEDASGKPKSQKGGKLLRPSLCLMACEAVGGDWKSALPAAAALELVHNFSLIHDDIEDGDLERRGLPTVWHLWGLAQGVNTGDAMHTVARLALLRLTDKGYASEKVVRAARLLDQACLRVCEGQCLDISFEERMDIGVDDYLEMIGGKTAALFSCSLKLGALLGTDDGTTVERMAEFGRNLGMAFQIQDDILGIWGESSVTGKSSSGDIIKKKKTLPVLYGISKAQSGQRSRLVEIYSKETVMEQDIPEVLGILDSAAARAYSENQASDYLAKALVELESASIINAAKSDFQLLAQSLAGREY